MLFSHTLKCDRKILGLMHIRNAGLPEESAISVESATLSALKIIQIVT